MFVKFSLFIELGNSPKHPALQVLILYAFTFYRIQTPMIVEVCYLIFFSLALQPQWA
jgi:hypothetical protein